LQVAKQAHRLATVLRDLVGDVAKTGVANRELRELAIARRLDERPAGRGRRLVGLRLRPAVRDRIRRAGARDQRRDDIVRGS
jgi:hypothetical protein